MKNKLKDVSLLITKGTTPTTLGDDFTKTGVNFVKSESITNSKYLDSTIFEHISEETNAKMQRSQIKENDLLFSIAGAYLGKIAIVRNCDLPLNTNQAVGIVRIDEEKANVDYLYYFYSQKQMNKYINKLSSQSSQPNLNLELLGNLPLKLLSLNEQNKIAEVLSSIDSKIETNNRINAELESMAKTIYDYWFTQFDFPDENGKPYKSSGGKMVWNEELKREIPEGWGVVNLESFINVIRGVSYSPDEVSNEPKENYVPLLKLNNLQNGRLILDDIIYVPKANIADNQYLSNNSVFVTMSSGSTEHVGKTALIPFDTEYCYGAFCSKIEIKPEFRCFISCFFLSDYFKRLIRTIVIGTSIKNISNEHLTNNLIAIPANTDNYIINDFERIISPFFDKQAEIIKENQQLASLRDWLLPMLMNGQVGFEGVE